MRGGQRRIAAALVLVLSLLGCAAHAKPVDPGHWPALSTEGRIARLTRELGSDFRHLRLPGARVRFIEVPGPPDGADGSRPILFVHGIGGGLGDFGPVMLKARGTARLVALDLPGFGGSVSERHDYSVSGAAKMLGAFITRLGLAPVRLACHSLGGQVCLQLALEKRQLIHDLTLVAPAGVYRHDEFVREMTRQVGVSTGRVQMSDPARALSALLTHGDDAIMRRLVAQNPRTLAALASFRENLHTRLGELEVPTLVVWGTSDRVLPMADGFTLAAAAGATLHLVEHAGHSPQLSHPEKIHAWMQSLPVP